jgi:hypothetical protein
MIHILLDLNSYIDMWLSTQLVNDLYLNSMEGHFLIIYFDKLTCKYLSNTFFFINNFPHVATLVVVVDAPL